MSDVYNFSAGPSMLPVSVLEQAQNELRDWKGMTASVMEMSHRSQAFVDCLEQAEHDLRDLMAIPENYKVLFCQGGGCGQFMAVPLNLFKQGQQQADYINSGFWGLAAITEASRVGQIHQQDIRIVRDGKRALKPMNEWKLTPESTYLHYCANETIEGIASFECPSFGDRTVVSDFSSTILSSPIDVSQFGVIYAGAQKNIGPSGLAIVIIREDLLNNETNPALPSILNYKILADNNSMYNTPPTFSCYLSGLVFKWLKEQGGVSAMAVRNKKKAQRLYDCIDNSGFYHNNIDTPNRSLMNVTFSLADPALDKTFIIESTKANLLTLSGHRSTGGIRASIYNAMPIEGVVALVDFMKDFERRYG